jgi:membrane fusion protein (multidrug efflux system)
MVLLKTVIGGTMKKNVLKYLVSSFLLLLGMTGCSKDQASNGGFSMPPMPVETVKVSKQNVSLNFDAVGTIKAVESITVVSEIDAAVVSLPFTEGSSIKKGDLIAQLDDSQLTAEVNRAEALYLQNKANFERVKTVVEQKAGTPQDLDDATASLKVAEANLALAKSRFTKTRITAPFDGIVGTRKVSIGTFLRVGQPVTELANLDQIRVEFSAPERFIPQLKKGYEVTVTTPVYADFNASGKIIAVEPVLNAETRTVQVVALVRNPGQKLRPGMSADVAVLLSEREDALTVPNEAVFAAGNQSFVFVVKPDSSVARVPIKEGIQLADVVEVVSGLEPDVQVVSAGHQKLFDGAKIVPIPSQEEILSREDTGNK